MLKKLLIMLMLFGTCAVVVPGCGKTEAEKKAEADKAKAEADKAKAEADKKAAENKTKP